VVAQVGQVVPQEKQLQIKLRPLCPCQGLGRFRQLHLWCPSQQLDEYQWSDLGQFALWVPAMMIEQRPIVLHSKWLFAFMVIGFLVYAVGFVEQGKVLPNKKMFDVFLFGAYSLFGIVFVYVIWACTIIVELGQNEITVSTLFGLRSPTRLKMKDIRRIIVRPDYSNQASRLVIKFANGRKVELHQFQKNFEAGRLFLAERLKEVPWEVQPKWAL